MSKAPTIDDIIAWRMKNVERANKMRERDAANAEAKRVADEHAEKVRREEPTREGCCPVCKRPFICAQAGDKRWCHTCDKWIAIDVPKAAPTSEAHVDNGSHGVERAPYVPWQPSAYSRARIRDLEERSQELAYARRYDDCGCNGQHQCSLHCSN